MVNDKSMVTGEGIAPLTLAEQLNALNERIKRTSEILAKLDRLADRMIKAGKEAK